MTCVKNVNTLNYSLFVCLSSYGGLSRAYAGLAKLSMLALYHNHYEACIQCKHIRTRMGQDQDACIYTDPHDAPLLTWANPSETMLISFSLLQCVLVNLIKSQTSILKSQISYLDKSQILTDLAKSVESQISNLTRGRPLEGVLGSRAADPLILDLKP